VVVSEPKGLAFAAVFGEDKVAVIDLRSRSLIREIPVGASPWGLSTTRAGDKIAVANFYGGSISIISVDDINKADGVQVETYRVGGKKPGDQLDTVNEKDKLAQEGVMGRAKHAVLANDGTLMFTDLAGNTVNTVNLNTKTLVGSVKVGLAPYGIDFLPQGRLITPASLTSR
jgi:DNA-binding beta-propeller fold protein YncE